MSFFDLLASLFFTTKTAARPISIGTTNVIIIIWAGNSGTTGSVLVDCEVGVGPLVDEGVEVDVGKGVGEAAVEGDCVGVGVDVSSNVAVIV